jgi:hypothetical protein
MTISQTGAEAIGYVGGAILAICLIPQVNSPRGRSQSLQCWCRPAFLPAWASSSGAQQQPSLLAVTAHRKPILFAPAVRFIPQPPTPNPNPQIGKIIKTRSTGDIALSWALMYIVGLALTVGLVLDVTWRPWWLAA